MKKYIFGFFLLVCFALPQEFMGQLKLTDIPTEHLVSGKIRIKIKEDRFIEQSSIKSISTETELNSIGIRSIDGLNKQNKIQRIERVFPFSIKTEAKHRKHGLHLWFELSYNGDVNPQAVVAQYALLDEVEIAKPVLKKVRLDGDKKALKVSVSKLSSMSKRKQFKSVGEIAGIGVEFNDPLLSDQWHYENDGTIGESDEDIDLAKAWLKSTGDSSVVVAIVDGGIDTEHEDLKENIWVNEVELNGEEGVDDDKNGFVDDYHGSNFVFGGALTAHQHGTHVAGTIGAVSNNNIGVAGVAGGDGTKKGVKLMSCQVFDDQQQSGGNFAAAIVYGADNGALISQNSWGYTDPGYYEPEVLDAVRYFIAEAGDFEGSLMKGGVLFFAAGNDGLEQTHYPAAFEEVIAVSAVGPDGKGAPYTNTGEWTDIAAPGGNQSTFDTKGGVLSTLPNNDYGYMQGTSMACPHVSGVAALVVSKFGGDDFRAEDLKNYILGSTTNFNFEHNDKYGIGILNASNALDENDNIKPEAITDLSSNEVYHNAAKLEWTVPVDEDNFQPSYFYLAASSSEITANNFDDQQIYKITNPFEAGDAVSVTFAGLLKKSDYWFAIKSSDRFENISSISNIIKVTTTDEPHFMMSTDVINLDINTAEESKKIVPVSFSNTGDGIISWYNYVYNERLYFEEQEDLNERIAAKAQTSSSLASITSTSQLQAARLVQSKGQVPDYLSTDKTQFKYGMSYEPDNNETLLYGNVDPNVGIIFATRFNVELDYTFNLTHLELALYVESKANPLLIEIKKGSKAIQTAETVYVQEYYPDTTDYFNYCRIPLYRPQRFEDGEVFWVVVHMPKEETKPLGLQSNSYLANYFMLSEDNGRSFRDFQQSLKKPFVPMLRALSSGDDGAYVFLDPNEGEIKKSETQNVNVIIDAENITNGKHIASVGIVTNDIHKPVVNIEVNLNVTGQKADVDGSKVHSFDVYSNKINELQLPIKNIGLGELEVYNIASDESGFAKAFTDTIQISSGNSGNIPFTFFNTGTGSMQSILKLITNEGELLLTTQMNIGELAELEMTLDKSEINLLVGETAELELSIKNTSASANLEYNLEHYDALKIKRGLLSNTMEYLVSSSDDVGGPQENQWYDIEKIGTTLSGDSIQDYYQELDMVFPFFNETFKNLRFSHAGNIIFYSEPGKPIELPSKNTGFYYNGGLIAPLFVSEGSKGLEKVVYYHYGDRFVATFYMNIGISYSEAPKSTLCYQAVLHRNGTIEYRYKDVEDLADEIDYMSVLQGMTPEDYAIYKNLNQPGIKISNGLVVRFEPTHSASLVTDASSQKGSLLPGEETKVKLTVDPTALERCAGEYDNLVYVNCNTANQIEELQLRINVTGIATLETQDNLDFDATKVDVPTERHLKVLNTGTGATEITAITFADASFSIDEVFPIKINGQSHLQLVVKNTPSVANELSSSMHIECANGQQLTVVLNSIAQVDPKYTISLPASLSRDLVGGELVRIPFTITNTSNGADLSYEFINSVFGQVKNSESPQVNEHSGSSTYSWKTSDDTKVFHKWFDIIDEANVLPVANSEILAIELPFEFPFYGQAYDSIWVSQNGYVSFQQPEEEKSIPSFKKGDGVRGMIAPFWQQLTSSALEEGVYVKKAADRIFIQWNNLIGQKGSATAGSLTFQLELLNDGTIFFHYKDIESWAGEVLYGLESPDENQVLYDPYGININWSDLKNETTVAIAPPFQGQVAPGEHATLDLLMSAENIYKVGSYKDTVELRTNSNSQAIEIIPFEINVTVNAKLMMEDNIECGDVIFTNNLSLRKKVRIQNYGHGILSVEQLVTNNLEDATFFDPEGNKINQNSAGTLLKPIHVNPWNFADVEIEFSVLEKGEINGTIGVSGNFESKTVGVLASIVDSPVFAWDASDQFYNLNSDEIETYEFSITNNGETTLDYSLMPAVINNDDSNGNTVIEEEIGNYEFKQPLTIDSLAIEFKELADGVLRPDLGGVRLGFSNRFTAPEEGFSITHVKSFINLDEKGEYVRVMVYKDGDLPQSGEQLYQEDFIIDESVADQWVYFPLKQTIKINGGEDFYIIILPPEDYKRKYIGYEVSKDESLLARCYTGNYSEGYKWKSMLGDEDDEEAVASFPWVWKIRPLTAASEGQWLKVDHTKGRILSGESTNITATIDANKAGSGDHKAKLLISSNDINNIQAEASLNLTVNGAPNLVLRPNQYADSLEVVENNKLLVSYLAEDPEGEHISFSKKDVTGGPRVKMKSTGERSVELEFFGDYQSSGIYHYPLELADESGNMTRDTILLKVIDMNRAPQLTPGMLDITLNMADPTNAFTIDPKVLFTDPDGDELEILAGNYTPDIIDLALGSNYIDIHPLSIGTGYIVLGADDGKDNGYVLYGVYVQVINDESVVGANPDGLIPHDGLPIMNKDLLVFPNVVSNQTSTVRYQLKENGSVVLEVIDISGRAIRKIANTTKDKGVYQQQVDFSVFGKGIYLCRYMLNGKLLQAEKVIVK